MNSPIVSIISSMISSPMEFWRPVQAYLGDLADRAYELSDVGGQVGRQEGE